MIILVLNCGSSSIKYQLINMANESQLLAKGIVERVGFKDAILTHKPVGKDKPYARPNTLAPICALRAHCA